jgi:hypothetical protein
MHFTAPASIPNESNMFNSNTLHLSTQWRDALNAAGLLDIEAVTKRDFNWFEPPNKRRGGWSGVTRIVLNPDAAPQDKQAVFLKIQQNHFYRAPSTCFTKQLTFKREFEVLQQLSKATASIPELVLFATWQTGSDVGAILVTRALDDWYPLNDWLSGQKGLSAPDEATSTQALEAIAQGAREIHAAGWVHLCFSGKHLFVRPQNDACFQSCVIDMEKSRKHFSLKYRIRKDCSHFMRHTRGLSEAQKITFLKAYFQTDTFSQAQKRLIQSMRGAPEI